MKAILMCLQVGLSVQVGKAATLFRYDDGTIGVRMEGSGLVTPSEPATLAGLRRLLTWLDHETVFG